MDSTTKEISQDIASATGRGASPSNSPGLPTPQRYWAAFTLLVAISIVVLDTSIANVALPTISKDLQINPSSSIWIVNAYAITIVGTLLPLSALAERIGFRKLFSMGLMIFTLGSLFCALSTSLTTLALSRVFQGLGAATIMALLGGMVRNIYPPNKLAAGISLNAMTVGVMSVLGPTIGAFILSIASWPWIFAVNVPICLIAALGMRSLPNPVAKKQKKFDGISAILSFITFTTFISGLDSLSHNTGLAFALICVSAICATLAIKRSLPQQSPLMPVDLFRIDTFAYAVGVSAATFAAAMCVSLSIPFYGENVLGLSTQEVGLLLGAWPIGSVLIAPFAGRLSNKYPASLLAGCGALLMGIGVASILIVPQGSSIIPISLSMLAGGLGFGLFQTPNNKAMLLSAPLSRSGAAGGVQATTRLFGQGIGGAMVAIAFSISHTYGALWALSMSCLLVLVAVLINLIRFAKGKDLAIN